jgi:hypothetical protein
MKPDTPISIDVSPGELIDKLTILEIKAERFEEPEKLRHVRQELAMLQTARARSVEPSDQLTELTGQLMSVNIELWEFEDAIRLCEQHKDFGPRFVTLARSIYRTNDRRCELKRQINTLVGTSLIEEKKYPPYNTGAEDS